MYSVLQHSTFTLAFMSPVVTLCSVDTESGPAADQAMSIIQQVSDVSEGPILV